MPTPRRRRAFGYDLIRPDTPLIRRNGGSLHVGTEALTPAGLPALFARGGPLVVTTSGAYEALLTLAAGHPPFDRLLTWWRSCPQDPGVIVLSEAVAAMYHDPGPLSAAQAARAIAHDERTGSIRGAQHEWAAQESDAARAGREIIASGPLTTRSGAELYRLMLRMNAARTRILDLDPLARIERLERGDVTRATVEHTHAKYSTVVFTQVSKLRPGPVWVGLDDTDVAQGRIGDLHADASGAVRAELRTSAALRPGDVVHLSDNVQISDRHLSDLGGWA